MDRLVTGDQAPSAHNRRPRTLSLPLPEADIVLVFDGGSLGNPGKGYGSFFTRGAVETSSPVRFQLGDQKTNNEAEYLSLIHGLRHVLTNLDAAGHERRANSIKIFSDSKLIVEQVNGRWKVRHAGLRPLHEEARTLLNEFASWALEWQPRVESVRLLGH
jgi:ribonuclease HI